MNVFGQDLKLLVPAALNHTYLNVGTLGPTPTTALAAAAAQELEWEEVGPGHVPFYLGARAEMRKFSARLEQNFSGGTVTLTENSSASILRILWGLDFKAGDEVITSDQEHGTVLYALSSVARRFGLVVKIASLTAENGIVSEVRRLLSSKTRLVIISQVSYLTGWEIPVAAIAEETRRYPACRFLVDGAQALGNIVVNPESSGADYYVFCGHKWMMAPAGWAGLWVRSGRLEDLFTVWADEGELDALVLSGHPYPPQLERGSALEFGSRSWPRIVGWAITWDYFEEEGFAHQASYQGDLANSARDRIALLAGYHPVAPIDPMMKTTALMTVHSDVFGSAIAEKMWQKNIFVKPVDEYQGMRISWALFNTADDLHQLVEALISF